jgi:signal peptidase II
LAGAVGNLIDRVLLGHVVDFIYFEIINFPLFNFADSCLTVSSILLFLLAIFYYKDEDFAFLDQIFRRKKVAKAEKESKVSEEVSEDTTDVSTASEDEEGSKESSDSDE